MNKSLNQVLRLQEILKLANPDAPQHRFSSAPKSVAQSSTLCLTRKETELLQNKILRVISIESNYPVPIKAVIELMFLNGLRISEVVKIKGSDVSAIGNIHIKGSKGSKDRYAQTGIYKKFWIGFRTSTCSVGDDYSRYFFYREFKKLGLSLPGSGEKNMAITHCFRHLLVQTNQEQHNELELSQNQLGHKSIKSTKHYDNSKKGTRSATTK